MVIKINYDKCTGCMQCLEVCPINAIKKEDKIIIDYSRCIKCRTCVVSCPSNAIYVK